MLHPGTGRDPECIGHLVEANLDSLTVEYEVLSWDRGDIQSTATILLLHEESFYLTIPKGLAEALHSLRLSGKSRMLWIDIICLNPLDSEEKNQYIEIMPTVYARSKSLCIWLGNDEKDRNGKLALDFIKNDVLSLRSIEELWDDPTGSPKWAAILNIMSPRWFTCRWSISEVLLAPNAVIICGKEVISWKAFTEAIQLFIEVETATHRISDVMKKDPKYYHIPGWFEYVSALERVFW